MIKTNRFLLLISIVWISLLYSGCSLLDSDAPSPMFIEIPSVSISTVNGQGETTHKITDVWVNANGISLGVFPLPARIPVIIDDMDSLTITVFAGIRNNGVTESAFIYKLLRAEQYHIPLETGATVVKTPVFKYSDNAKFDFVESFEGENIFTFKGTSNEGGCLLPTNESAASGQRSGVLALDMDSPSIEVGTIFLYDGAGNGGESYIEIDYKNDIPFFVGIYKTVGNTTIPIYNVLIAEKEEWNKIYLDFSLELKGNTNSIYRVMIFATLEGLNTEEGTVYVDNIKSVHF